MRGFESLRYHTCLAFPSYNLKDAGASVYGASFAVIKKPAAGSERKGTEQDVGESSETILLVKSYKRESRDGGYSTQSENSPEALDFEITAASIPHDWLIVASLTLFGVNVYLDTLLTDCNEF